jgi:glycerol-3-phosphate acyltransferase PlsX
LNKVTRIAVDIMGGDKGLQAVLDAVRRVAAEQTNTEFTLVGNQALIQDTFANLPIAIHHADDQVSMHDKPAVVLRQKKESSMWKALELVSSGRVDACVSGGNTGALMAMGKYLLKTFPGIDRPAICKAIPAKKGHCYLLDLGANINCSAEQLVQFAFMGTVLAAACDNNPNPRVGLLNIGEENIKGIEQVRLAADLLRQQDKINFVGFVEGNEIYTGDVDVVVCDGFVGNIALKVSEGAARFLADSVREVFEGSTYGKLVGKVASPIVNRWRKQYDPVRHNGASFLGLQGTVIKSHGSADSRGFYHALQMAIDHVSNNIPEKINAQFGELFA